MPPLVRKKSGELLKPSLKSSASTRNFSVRFNNTLDIKHFNGDESPKCVSGQNSPVLSPDDETDFEDDYFSVPLSRAQIASTNIDNSASSSTIQLKSLKVVGSRLVGTVHCLNLAFEKHFSVKLTFNGWKSSVIFGTSNFSYVKSVGHYDEFNFVINTNLHSLDFEFVVSYTVENQTFWDNNRGRNYKVSMTMASTPKFDFYSTGAESPTATAPDLDSNYLYEKLVNIDYNSILQNYCFHSEPSSESYFSLHDGISI